MVVLSRGGVEDVSLRVLLDVAWFTLGNGGLFSK